ncbi:MAG: ATPase, T2SS/T4P/T4SS family [Candidatus Kuenenbacteria bacterium]
MSQQNITFNKIIDKSIKSDASYLHLETGSMPIIRIGSKLAEIDGEALIDESFLSQLVESFLSAPEKEKLEKDKSIVVVRSLEGNKRFRIDIFYQKKTLAMVLKYIKPVIQDLKKLGLSDEFIKLLHRREGLIVLSGKHGSGKTAMAVSILEFINVNQSKYIVTLEKPIEYILNPQKSIIEQREIGRDANTFEHAIKFAQDGDADIVFLSEISTYQSLINLFKLISSGRLVIAIVEAQSVPETLEQLVDLSPQAELEKSKQMLADLLLGVTVKHLLPRRGGGQVDITEILINLPPVSSLIKEGKYRQINNVMQTSRDEGMRTRDQSLIELVRTGEITYEDAFPIAMDKVSFQTVAK